MVKARISPNMLTATQMVHAIAAEKMTSVDIVSACLDRISERDGDVRAWVAVNWDGALKAAKMLDRSVSYGPLWGVPFAVKDVIDTAELPTEMGSQVYKGYQPLVDASCVAMARKSGAIMLGKTVTAEFAGSAPTLTRNPHNLDHTPGGSSSGSAAAVADFHVPVAYGTQTGGSILRPASFCGVFGFKPTFGAINPVGVKPAAESFDTVGMITRSIEDIALFNAVLRGDRPVALAAFSSNPVIGLWQSPGEGRAQQETINAIEEAADKLSKAGATVKDITLPSGFFKLTEARAIINAYERARSLVHEWHQARDRMTSSSVTVCQKGFAIPTADYIDAKRQQELLKLELAECFDGIDAMLAPCVNGEAPHGLDYAGDPHFQECWTMLYTPTLTLPTHSGSNGLPVGIQLIAPRYEDDRLLAVAAWVWKAMDKAGSYGKGLEESYNVA